MLDDNFLVGMFTLEVYGPCEHLPWVYVTTWATSVVEGRKEGRKEGIIGRSVTA